MSKKVKNTKVGARASRVGSVSGKSEKSASRAMLTHRSASKKVGRTGSSGQFRKLAAEVLTEHRRALEWLKDK